MQPNRIEVAMTLLAHLGGTTAYSREFEGVTLHAIELPAHDVPIFLAEQAGDSGGEDLVGGDAWIGAEIGTFPCTTELYRLLAGSHHASGRLATFPSLVRAGRVRLWRREPLIAEEMSLRDLETLTRRLVDDAADLTASWSKALAAAHESPCAADLQVEEVLARIDTELRAGGHDEAWPFWLWSAGHDNAHLIEAPREHRWTVGDEGWVAPVLSTDPRIAGDFLRLGYPPNCLNGLVADDKVLVYGAIGSMAFAVEDREDPALAILKLLCGHRQPTVLDVLASHLELASKGEPMFQQTMPHGPFGWARPFLLVGSSISGEGEVHVWDTTAGAVVLDHQLTAAWRHLIHEPGSAKLTATLLTLFNDRFQHLTNPRHDNRASTSTEDLPTMTDLDQQLASLAPRPQVAQALRDVVARRSVITDRRGSYISVRPAPVGAIAAYFHAHKVSIAVEPNDAATVAARLPGSSIDPKTPATSYVMIDMTHGPDHAQLVETISAAVDWRASGPPLVLGADRTRNQVVEPDLCPDCNTTITPAGTCMCDD